MSELPPSILSPSTLLLRLADELLRCETMLRHIEHGLLQVHDGSKPSNSARVWQKNIQAIDLLEQKLGDLSQCLTAMSREPSLQAAPDLSEARLFAHLKLDDLRCRLRGQADFSSDGDRVEVF